MSDFALQQKFNWNRPDISSYVPTDWFSASSSLPEKTDEEAEREIERIGKQANAVKILLANLALTKMLVRADAVVTDVDAAIAQNSLKLAAHQMKLGFEAQKLSIDQGMYGQLTQLHQQKANIRVAMTGVQIQAMQAKLQQAQSQLSGGTGGGEGFQRQSFSALGAGRGSSVLERARDRAAQSRQFLEGIL